MSWPRRLLPVLTLAVGFAAGIGVGLLLAPEEPSPTAPARSPAPTRSPSDPERDDVERIGAEARPPRERRTRPAVAETPSAAARTDAVIVGVVVDPDGLPLPGVRVTGSHPNGPSEATTDADGAYRLTGLRDGQYLVAAAKDRYVFGPTAASRVWLEPGGVCDFVGTRAGRLVVRPLLPDGSVPAAAHVSVHGDPDSEELDWTPATPHLDLRPGTYTVHVTAAGAGELAAPSVEVEVAAGADQEVTVQLAPRPGVFGTIRFARGQPEGLVVLAVPLSAASPDADAVDGPQEAAPSLAHVAAPFEYALRDLEPGTYRLAVVLRNGRELAAETVVVTAEPTRADFEIAATDLDDTLRVHALAPDGRPLIDVSFAVRAAPQDAPDDPLIDQFVPARRLQDGWFEVPPVLSSFDEQVELMSFGDPGLSMRPMLTDARLSLGKMRFVLTVASPRFGRVRVPFDPRTDRRLTARFEIPAHANVRLAGAAGSRGGSAWSISWTAVDDGADPTDSGGTLFGAKGVARVGPLSPGTYVVTVDFRPAGEVEQAEGWYDVDESVTVATERVTLTAGENEIRMPVPELQDLSIVVPEEFGDLDLDLYSSGAEGEELQFLREGVVRQRTTRFRSVPPGTYRVRDIGWPSRGELIVHVPGPTTLPFRPKTFDSLRVGGPPETLQEALRAGDVVVAVAGTRLDETYALERVYLAIGAAKTVVLRVRRGGSEIEVEVPADAVAQGIGTWLERWTR